MQSLTRDSFSGSLAIRVSNLSFQRGLRRMTTASAIFIMPIIITRKPESILCLEADFILLFQLLPFKVIPVPVSLQPETLGTGRWWSKAKDSMQDSVELQAPHFAPGP